MDPAPGLAQNGLGLLNDRAHPEKRWLERETEHFIAIYAEGLEDVAVRALTIAEQVYEPITRGMQVEMGGKTSIFLSDEDQIVNGFALPRRMFIWVNVNDYPTMSGGNDKWLRLVIAHEFQHNVWMEAAQDWTGVWSMIGTPTWFIEGLAEYKTEEWGAFRSDLRLRNFILRNRHRDLDPHDSGFTRVRYLAETYGDSVLVRAVHERGPLGLARFGTGFRKAAGISLRDFEEEWRRVATAHTYAVYSQKERVEDVGEHLKSPAQRLMALAYSPDARFMAALFQPSGELPVLAVVANDSTEQWYPIDHGRIRGSLSFSADGDSLVYAKFHRSHHGSLLWDLKVADVQNGRSRWITSGRRASHPHWSPRGDRIVFTAVDGSTTNIYTCDPAGENVRALTQHPDDVQVLTPRFSPDGKRLVFVRFEPGRSVDLAVMDLDTRETRYVTENRAHDMRPRWSHDGKRIFFTSDRNADEVPNLFTVPADGDEFQVEPVSDVGEALYTMDVQPDSGHVVAIAMASTDTVRLRRIDPSRRTVIVDPVIDPRFVRWRDRVPPHPIPEIDYRDVPEMTSARPYRAWRHPRTFAWLVLPSPWPWGVMASGIWVDSAHRNSLLLGVDLGTDDDTFRMRSAFGRWDTIDLPFGISGDLAVAGGWDARQALRIYAGDLLVATHRHASLRWRLPLNAGEHLYANHAVELWSDFADVDVDDVEDFDPADLASENLPALRERYTRNTLGFTYRYRKRRPHRTRNAHPRRGHGLLAQAEWSGEALGSEVPFRRLTLDASSVLPPWLPLAGVRGATWFARARGQAVWGEPAPQDFTGLRADPAILPQRYSGSYVFDDVLELRDSYFVRGFPRNVLGEQALVTTLEWRVPLTRRLPVSAFGVSLGGVTGVAFYDHGRVWGGSDALARHTVGWEVRLPVRLFGRTLLVPAYGEGQTLPWERDGAPFTRDEYFMIAMTRAF